MPEVIAQAGLLTFVVKGADVRRYIEQLSEADGVLHVAFFGALLHVSGRDRAKLEAAVAPLRGQPSISVEEVQTSLEDAFIDLQSDKVT